MKTAKSVISALLAMVISVASFFSLSAFAANYTSNYSKYTTPSSSSDYAYWNGSQVKKASGTTKKEIQWMQASLNYCIDKKGLNASKLDVDGSFGPASKETTKAFQKATNLEVDGSFGPATIKKMKDVLNGKVSLNKSNTSATNAKNDDGKISTSDIQAVLDEYGYKDGKYWTTKESGNKKSDCSTVKYTRTANLYASSNKATKSGSYKSYNYEGQWECHGFACYVMAKVTDTDVIPRNGDTKKWDKITKVTSLKVGDIVRSSNGHTAIVLSIDDKGNCTFAECWGSVNSQINIGKFNNSCSTLSSIKNKYGIAYIYRYIG